MFTLCVSLFVLDIFWILRVLWVSGVGVRWHGRGRSRCGPGGDDDAGDGARHQDHLQRRHSRQHAVELQASADRDLRKTKSILSPGFSASSGLGPDPFDLWFSRWFQVRPRWLSTEPETPQTTPSSASPPTTWCRSRRGSTSTRSRCVSMCRGFIPPVRPKPRRCSLSVSASRSSV